ALPYQPPTADLDPRAALQPSPDLLQRPRSASDRTVDPSPVPMSYGASLSQSGSYTGTPLNPHGPWNQHPASQAANRLRLDMAATDLRRRLNCSDLLVVSAEKVGSLTRIFASTRLTRQAPKAVLVGGRDAPGAFADLSVVVGFAFFTGMDRVQLPQLHDLELNSKVHQKVHGFDPAMHGKRDCKLSRFSVMLGPTRPQNIPTDKTNEGLEEQSLKLEQLERTRSIDLKAVMEGLQSFQLEIQKRLDELDRKFFETTQKIEPKCDRLEKTLARYRK
ncbi:hypothetical protein HDU96_002054, partial [Phlyctochytrium bullatum]